MNSSGRLLIAFAGQGLITIARDWNQRGVLGTTASPLDGADIAEDAALGAIAGLREHGADPRGRVLGSLTPAVWEGAVDRSTWDHVRALLMNPERLTLGNTPTTYLLMGLIWPYASEWGVRILIRGGRGRLGHVTPPAWRSTRSR